MKKTGKKRISLVLALLLAAASGQLAAPNVRAAEMDPEAMQVKEAAAEMGLEAMQVKEAAAEMDSEVKDIEIGQYLDEEKPEVVAELLDMDPAATRFFGEAGIAYEKEGLFLEYYGDIGSSWNAVLPITFTATDDGASYHGISCGVSRETVDHVMREEGWYTWHANSQSASYMKEANRRWYTFYVSLSNGRVTDWEWINWTQGDFGEVPFPDVPENAWFFEPVRYVHRNWLMTGLSNGNFGPGENLARAQFAVILYRMNGEPEVTYTTRFPDVAAGQWYTDAILWAADTGVVTGYSDTGNFGPSDNINREQMAVMMYRYAQDKGYDVSQKADYSKYPDAGYVNTFAKEAMSWAVGTGIITGTDEGTRLNPQGKANRAECATIIMRFCEKYGN